MNKTFFEWMMSVPENERKALQLFEAWAQARKEALEEAARVCDEHSDASAVGWDENGDKCSKAASDMARDLAEIFRALAAK